MKPIEDQLILHEGLVPHAYQDSLGYWTIGVGRLIDKRKGGGLTKQESLYLLRNDIAKVTGQLGAYPWYNTLDPVRQKVIVDMVFNMGLAGVLGFKKMIAALERRDYENAAVEMLDSRWARQVGFRSLRLAQMMQTGKDYD